MKKGIALVFVLGALALGVSPAYADTWVVDAPNPELECENADFPSIQAAVTAAAPGDTIQVCPGLYNESVTVPKTLELNGAGGDPTRRTGDATREAVVAGPTLFGYGFSLEANSIEVRGFTIENIGGVVFDPLDGGIRTSPVFSGYLVEQNLFRDNTPGTGTAAVRVASNGVFETTIGHNAFGNEKPGSTGDYGIVNRPQTPGTLINITIEHNLFTQYESTLIELGRGTGIRIHHNLMRDNGPNSATTFGELEDFEFAYNRNINSREIFPLRVNGRMHHNSFEDAQSAGIEIFNQNPDLLIDHNSFENRSYGILAVNQVMPGLLIEENDIRASTFFGIYVSSTRGITVRGNDVKHSGRNGIHVSGSSENLFEDNRIKHSADFDASDDNRAANVWIDTKCKTDFPPGTICE